MLKDVFSSPRGNIFMDSGTTHVTSYILTYSRYFRKTKPQVRTDRTNHCCHLSSRSYKLGSTPCVPFWQSQWTLTPCEIAKETHFTGEKLKFQERDASLRVTGLTKGRVSFKLRAPCGPDRALAFRWGNGVSAATQRKGSGLCRTCCV